VTVPGHSKGGTHGLLYNEDRGQVYEANGSCRIGNIDGTDRAVSAYRLVRLTPAPFCWIGRFGAGVRGGCRVKRGQWVLSVAFSHDGKWIAAGTLGGLLTVWEMPTGHSRWSYKMKDPFIR